MRRFLIFFSVGALLCFSLVLHDAQGTEEVTHTNKAFSFGERLVYRLYWYGIPAGKAVMEVQGPVQKEGKESYRLISTVRSNDFVSFFYPVEDRVESFVDVQEMLPLHIVIRQHQGKKRREKEVIFDRHNGVARMIKNGKEEAFEIPPTAQDFLSSLYYLRTMDHLEVGQSALIDIHESKKNWQVEIKVVGREEVSSEVGNYRTLQAQASLQFEGIFIDKGELTFWLTDDERKIPVLLKAKLHKIGPLTAVLIEKRDGQL